MIILHYSPFLKHVNNTYTLHDAKHWRKCICSVHEFMSLRVYLIAEDNTVIYGRLYNHLSVLLFCSLQYNIFKEIGQVRTDYMCIYRYHMQKMLFDTSVTIYITQAMDSTNISMGTLRVIRHSNTKILHFSSGHISNSCIQMKHECYSTLSEKSFTWVLNPYSKVILINSECYLTIWYHK